MISFIKKLFGAKPAETVAEVPYKVEVAVTPVAEQAAEAVITSIPAKKAPAKKAVAKKVPAVKKPRAPKAAK